MDPLIAHERAQGVFSSVLASVRPDQMDAPTPCEEWTVRDLIEHVIAGNERVPIRAGLSSEPPSRPGDLLTAHRATADAAQAVFTALDMTALLDLPIGKVPGSAFLRIRTTDALVHAWDLAKATGQSTDLDPELATQQLLASRQNMSGSLRGDGRYFGEPQPCDENRSAADQLAAFFGRAVG